MRECIASLASAQRNAPFLSEIIVVDNGSTDNSTLGIDGLGIRVKLIRNDTNRGFAAACNQGAAAARADFLLFLNPDTRLNGDSLTVPFRFMEGPESTRVGICGIQLVEEAGQVCLSHAKFPTLWDFAIDSVGRRKLLDTSAGGHGVVSETDGLRIVDQVIGAFFFVRSSLWRHLAGFDERFFVYYEEVDFALRARQQGWASVCLTSAQCIHIGGASSAQVKDARLFYSMRSRLLYAFKHWSALSAGTLLFITIVPELLSRMLFALLRDRTRGLKHVLQGYSMLLKDMPAILATVAELRESPATPGHEQDPR